jgi:teichuronic acid biosynthesis glycosyltransferase TuaG
MNTDTPHVESLPKVSIVMPCFDSVAHIDATLRSLSEQIFQDYELIVVDDGSTDDTLLRVEEWRARLPCLKVIKSLQNFGPGDARNKGIGLAHANLIALIDPDDVWFKHKLELQVAVHAATDCAFSCTAFKFGDTEIFQSKTDYISLLKNNVINTASVMFDRSTFDFSPNIKASTMWHGCKYPKKLKFNLLTRYWLSAAKSKGHLLINYKWTKDDGKSIAEPRV